MNIQFYFALNPRPPAGSQILLQKIFSQMNQQFCQIPYSTPIRIKPIQFTQLIDIVKLVSPPIPFRENPGSNYYLPSIFRTRINQ